MLALYRRIIRNAKVYPSSNRDRILVEIRKEFRKNATETDPSKVDIQQQTAMKGLEQLMQYTSLNKENLNWSINLEKHPLGGPKLE
ncbi:unnamed protein product [Choristocarpus tenellus]